MLPGPEQIVMVLFKEIAVVTLFGKQTLQDQKYTLRLAISCALPPEVEILDA